MIDTLILILYCLLGFIMLLLSIHPHLQPDLDEEMGKVKDLQDTMKQMKEKMEAMKK